MVGRGSQFDFSKRPSCASHSHLLILSLIVVYYTTLSAPAKVLGKCKASKENFEHCGHHPDGVHGLDCFDKYKSGRVKCVWKPGKHKSQKTYALIVQQRAFCRAHINITELSESISLFKSRNVTVEVFESSGSTNCTKAVFSARPGNLLRCGPPYTVSFHRQSGKLDVDVSWEEEDDNIIEYYSVRYKALDSPLWNVSDPCQNRRRCTVENLNPSLTYAAQIQCVVNPKCTQCPWSEAHTIPSELTTQPVIVKLEDTDLAEKKGRRLVSVNWKFAGREPYDSYFVTVAKVSGEAPLERLNTSRPEITLILSSSAYQLNISAVNNASTSPAVSQTILQREDLHSAAAGRLNITAHSNTSFTVYWEDDLIKTYVCYCVEWMRKGHKAAYMSFYEDSNNYRTLAPLPEPLVPYKRYSITLYTRPDKDTCNMKRINNSESTYGTTQFYFIEGHPVRAPTNISSSNVTLNSMVLQWSPIPEEDIRGFLLGYIIYYTEHQYGGTSPERNVTVDPDLDSYELGGLKKDTKYRIQISGFTQAGVGIRSVKGIFGTSNQEILNHNLTGVSIVLAILAALLIFGSKIIKRAKVYLWPSIPNPGNSNAMQKIEGPCEMELLESINTLKVEEWDTSSLQVVEKETVLPFNTLPSQLPQLHDFSNEEDSPEMTCDWTDTDTEDATGDVLSAYTRDAVSDMKQANFQSFAFSSDYTTMDMFKQMMPASTAINQVTESDPLDTQLTVVKSELHYVRQFSTSPVSGSEDMSVSL